MGNTHIYEEHLDTIKLQIDRKPYKFPTLEIINKREDINDYIETDFVVKDYESYEAIKMKMIA